MDIQVRRGFFGHFHTINGCDCQFLSWAENWRTTGANATIYALMLAGF
jgi:hypothetical protein